MIEESGRRQQRFSSDEARTAVLAAGLELLIEHGMDIGLGRVRFNDAINRSGVPRGSAYRIWEGHPDLTPQDAFRLDLLKTNLKMGLNDGSAGTHSAIEKTATEQKARFESGDPKKLAAGLRELIRVAAAANLEEVTNSPEWYLNLASRASSQFGEASDPEVREAHLEGEEASVKEYIPTYQAFSEICGLKLRDGFTWEQFSSLCAAAAQGVGLVWEFNPHIQQIQRSTGENGALQDWTGFGILLEALMITCTEPDPAAPHSLDLAKVWL